MSNSSSGGLIKTVGVFMAMGIGGVYAINNRDVLAELATKSAVTASDAAGLNLKGSIPKSGANEAQAHDNRHGGDVELKPSDNGHYETAVEINGNEVDVMVDTGATLVALTFDDAERAGLMLDAADFTESVNTANGIAKIALVTLDTVSIGDITVRNVQGAVAERGRLHKTLLGMSFLNRLSRVEMGPKSLVLHE